MSTVEWPGVECKNGKTRVDVLKAEEDLRPVYAAVPNYHAAPNQRQL